MKKRIWEFKRSPVNSMPLIFGNLKEHDAYMSLSLNVMEYECNLSKFNALFVCLFGSHGNSNIPWVRTATLCCGIERTVGFKRRDQLNCLLFWAILKPQGPVAVVRVTSYLYIWFGNIHFIVDVIIYMYVNNLMGPWFSIYNVLRLKCEVERKTCNPV